MVLSVCTCTDCSIVWDIVWFQRLTCACFKLLNIQQEKSNHLKLQSRAAKITSLMHSLWSKVFKSLFIGCLENGRMANIEKTYMFNNTRGEFRCAILLHLKNVYNACFPFYIMFFPRKHPFRQRLGCFSKEMLSSIHHTKKYWTAIHQLPLSIHQLPAL